MKHMTWHNNNNTLHAGDTLLLMHISINIPAMHSISIIDINVWPQKNLNKNERRKKICSNKNCWHRWNFLSICLHSLLIAGNSKDFFLYPLMNNCLHCETLSVHLNEWFVSFVHPFIQKTLLSSSSSLVFFSLLLFCLFPTAVHRPNKLNGSGQIGIFIVSVRQANELQAHTNSSATHFALINWF